jgi:hypothetical protein
VGDGGFPTLCVRAITPRSLLYTGRPGKFFIVIPALFEIVMNVFIGVFLISSHASFVVVRV